MLIEKKRIQDMQKAAYNPRIALKQGDPEYNALKDGIEQYGLVIPVVWNKRTNNVVGGHQRLTILEDMGETEVLVSVVDIDEMREKQLNVMLNKAQGAWDDTKLAEMLEDLGDRATETGFSLPEIEALQSSIEDALDESFLDDELSNIERTFNVTVTFDVTDEADVNGYIKENGKEGLVALMIEAAEREV